jgi:serine/threonine-protein kinase
MSTPSPVADRNLLFGVLALQADLIDNGRFAEVCLAWAARKDMPLADLLVERGWLTAEERGHVQFLLDRKLKKHGGDARAGLAEVATDQVRQSLAGVHDAAVRQSLAGPTTPPAVARVLLTADYVPAAGARYTLSRLHATGGIGRVWLARDGNLGRDVALKELRPDRAGNPTVWARLLMEAQITGQLEHPGIVPIYEVGKRPEDDAPFYTMRFVRGRTLAEAASSYHRRSSRGEATGRELRDLLTAFVGVCNAVAYAHSRGVLHRDLKPSNVVLGDYGEVIVLDWGLARLTGAPADEQASPLNVAVDNEQATLQGQVLGTPAYMPPEQAEGRLDLLDERSDVYGLGAILYEVLTGQAPFAGDDTQVVLRKVTHEAPLPPRALAADTPWALQSICRKALAKKPAERYATASEFSQEVQRFLADEPVRAHRDMLPTRLARWGRRHRTLVAGAAAILVAAVIALSGGAILLGRANVQIEYQRARVQQERDRANDNFQKARETVNEYFTVVSENKLLKSPLPGLQPLRKELLQSALKYYQEFARQHDDDPALQLEIAAATARMGKINRAIGSKEEALRLAEKAVSMYEEMLQSDEKNEATRRGLVEALPILAHAQNDVGRTGDGVQTFIRCLAIGEGLVRQHPADKALQFDLAGSGSSLGMLQSRIGKPRDAVESLQRAAEVVKKLLAEDAQVLKYRNLQAGIYSNIGEAQMFGLAQYWQALDSFRTAIAIEKEVVAEDPSDVHAQYYLAMHYGGVGSANLYLGRLPESEEANQRSAEVLEKLARENPRVTSYQLKLAQGFINLSQVQTISRKHDKALETVQRGFDCLDKGVKEDPNDVDRIFTLAQLRHARGEVFLRSTRFAEAVNDFREAIVFERQVVAKAPESVHYQQNLGWLYCFMGEAQIGLRQAREAYQSWQEAVKVWRDCARSHPSDVGFRNRLPAKYVYVARRHALANAALEKDMPADARQHADQAVELLRLAVEGGKINGAELTIDKAFQSIRQRADFQKLVQGLGKTSSEEKKER